MTSNPEDKPYHDLTAAYVVRHTVNFAHDIDGGATVGGSGVLCRCGKVGGILTCAHVLSDILQRADKNPDGRVGIVANGAASDGRMQAIKMRLSEFKGLQRVIVRGGVETEDERERGPDLAFVRLADNTMSALGTIGSILSLDGQRALKGTPFVTGKGIEWTSLATGVIAELTEPVEERAGGTIVPFTTGVLSGTLHAEQAHGGYDRVRLKPDRTEMGYPQSLGGLSGGGLWTIAFKRDDAGTLLVADRRLVGVAYYQSAADEEGYRDVIGHGPASIYDLLVPQIEALAVAS